MSVTAFGSITLVDLTDIGEFSVNPMSNQPLSVIYDPNGSGTFTPNWGNSNLNITPLVYYAGQSLPMSTSGLSLSWQRQVGSGSIGDLTTGETVPTTGDNKGHLLVTQNKFADNSTTITYYVTAEYLEPTSQTTLVAKGQITFTMVKNSSNVKSCRVSGDNIFKYNQDGALITPDHLVLTGTTSTVSISQWQYYDDSVDPAQWKPYPVVSGHNTSNTGTTINIYADEAGVWSDDVLQIRLTTSDNNVFDIINVTKLRDGAPGSSAVTSILTNESQMIPCDANYNPISGAFDTAISTMKLYDGGVQQTTADGWSIAVSVSTGITGSRSTSSGGITNDTYTVTGMTTNTGYVDFTATKTGFSAQVKRFNLMKVKAGADGTSAVLYTIEAPDLVVYKSKDATPVLTPTTTTVSAYKWSGGSKTAYSGRFKIYAGDSSTASYTSSSNESSHQITLADFQNSGTIKVELYAAGGTTTLYDTQTITFVSQGNQGSQGNPGESAVNVILGNYADVIPVSVEYKTTSQIVLTVPFSAYKGTSKIACSVSGTPKLFNITPVITSATTSADGSIKWTIPANTVCGSASTMTGSVSITFVADSTNISKTYNWTLSKAAIDATDAVILQTSTPNGYIFSNGTGSLTVQGILIEGAEDKSSSVTTWKWYKYVNGTYTQITSSTAGGITGYNTSMITVPASAVSSYMSFKVVATYNSKDYVQYSFLLDKTDPVQATIFSTVGTQIINGKGTGAIYCKITRNGVEVDAMRTEEFVTALPSGRTSGTLVYLLDTVNKVVTLKKFNGSSWVTETEGYTWTYSWSYRDSNNEVITTGTPANSGKVIYIDSTLINKKLIIDCEVHD